LEITLSEINPDIVVLCEHKMTSPEIERLNIPGYKVNSFFSRYNSQGGGSIILSKPHLKFKLVNSQTLSELITEKEFELCLTEFTIDSFHFVLLAVYRSPNSNLTNFLKKLDITLNLVCKKFKNVILAGDLNINVLEKSHEHDLLCDTINGHGVKYLVDFPTRVSSNSKTAIDNFLINFDSNNIKITGLNTQLSDHDAQLLEIFYDYIGNIPPQTTTSKTCRRFSDSNINDFKDKLAQESWVTVFDAPVKYKYDEFMNIFMANFNECFPIINQKQHSNKKPKWYNEELRKDKQEIIKLNNISRSCQCANITEHIKKKRV